MGIPLRNVKNTPVQHLRSTFLSNNDTGFYPSQGYNNNYETSNMNQNYQQNVNSGYNNYYNPEMMEEMPIPDLERKGTGKFGSTYQQTMGMSSNGFPAYDSSPLQMLK